MMSNRDRSEAPEPCLNQSGGHLAFFTHPAAPQSLRSALAQHVMQRRLCARVACSAASGMPAGNVGNDIFVCLDPIPRFCTTFSMAACQRRDPSTGRQMANDEAPGSHAQWQAMAPLLCASQKSCVPHRPSSRRAQRRQYHAVQRHFACLHFCGVLVRQTYAASCAKLMQSGHVRAPSSRRRDSLGFQDFTVSGHHTLASSADADGWRKEGHGKGRRGPCCRCPWQSPYGR